MKNKQPEDFKFDRYIDGDLSPQEMLELESLMTQDDSLRTEIEEMRATRNAFRDAMHSEIEQVDFRGVWSAVNEAIEQDENARSEGFLARLYHIFLPNRLVAATASALAVIAIGIVLLVLFLNPITTPKLEASSTIIEYIEYGTDTDIVIAVDTLGPENTTVVYIQGLNLNPEDE